MLTEEASQVELVSLSRVLFNLEKDLTFELIGNSNGNLRFRFGGFSFDGSIKWELGAWLNAYVHFDADNIWLEGDYDIFTGVVSNLTNSNVNINVKTDIDSALGIIPGMDAFIEDDSKLNEY